MLAKLRTNDTALTAVFSGGKYDARVNHQFSRKGRIVEMSLGAGRMALQELIDSSEPLDLDEGNLEGLCEGELTALEYRLGQKVTRAKVVVERLRKVAEKAEDPLLRSAESDLQKFRYDLWTVMLTRRLPEHQNHMADLKKAGEVTQELLNSEINI